MFEDHVAGHRRAVRLDLYGITSRENRRPRVRAGSPPAVAAFWYLVVTSILMSASTTWSATTRAARREN